MIVGQQINQKFVNSTLEALNPGHWIKRFLGWYDWLFNWIVAKIKEYY